MTGDTSQGTKPEADDDQASAAAEEETNKEMDKEKDLLLRALHEKALSLLSLAEQQGMCVVVCVCVCERERERELPLAINEREESLMTCTHAYIHL